MTSGEKTLSTLYFTLQLTVTSNSAYQADQTTYFETPSTTIPD